MIHRLYHLSIPTLVLNNRYLNRHLASLPTTTFNSPNSSSPASSSTPSDSSTKIIPPTPNDPKQPPSQSQLSAKNPQDIRNSASFGSSSESDEPSPNQDSTNTVIPTPTPIPKTRPILHNGSGLDATFWYGLPFNARIANLLDLYSFSKDEIDRAFDAMDINGDGRITAAEVRDVLEMAKLPKSDAFVDEFMRIFMKQIKQKDSMTQIQMQQSNPHSILPPPIQVPRGPAAASSNSKPPILGIPANSDEDTRSITKEAFFSAITEIGNEIDPRVWKLSASMLIVGLSIGIIVPVMPLLMKQMAITPAEFGLVIASFGLTKGLGNIPVAFLADTFGRRPFMTYGMGLIALGTAGIAFTSNLYELVACRLLTGLGVSAFSSASFLCITDISNPLNRMRSLAPITAAFSAGAALGPAVGGVLADAVGLLPCFGIVGSSFGLLSLYHHVFVHETLSSSKRDLLIRERSRGAPGGRATLAAQIFGTLQQWGPIMRNPELRNLILMNMVYWFTVSGAQLTMLPLILASDTYGLSPTMIGAVFAGMSFVSVVGAPVAAWIGDKYGKRPTIVLACGVLGGSMISLPFVSNLQELVAVLGVWSLGSTLVGMAPTALIADVTPEKYRSQALALMRTTGDIGLLFGASFTGHLASYSGSEAATGANGGLLIASSLFYALGKTATAQKAKHM